MTFFKSLIIEVSFWQSSLFIFLLSLLAGIIGYVIKHFLDIKKSKRIKILSLELIVGAMYTNGSFVIPSLSLIIENLSKTDVIINYVGLKYKGDFGMAPISMIPKGELKPIKVYEIKKNSFQCAKTTLIINPKTRNLEKDLKTFIKTPNEFFSVLYLYMNLKTKPIKNKKDFEKRLSKLGVFVSTNIGNYYRKFTEKEREMFFKSSLMKQYDLLK